MVARTSTHCGPIVNADQRGGTEVGHGQRWDIDRGVDRGRTQIKHGGSAAATLTRSYKTAGLQAICDRDVASTVSSS